MNIKQCIEKGFLRKIKPDMELAHKEIKEALYDLEMAETSFVRDDYKWSIVKCYYSMFHAAKGLLFSLGYLEKKHVAIIVVLENYSLKGKIESRFVNDFKAAMHAREDADYSYAHSKDSAEYQIDVAKDFVKKVKSLLK